MLHWYQFRLSTFLFAVVLIAQHVAIIHLQIELRKSLDAAYEVARHSVTLNRNDEARHDGPLPYRLGPDRTNPAAARSSLTQ